MKIERVEVTYRDGSKRVVLKDGRKATLSAPYRDGSCLLRADDGEEKWLNSNELPK